MNFVSGESYSSRETLRFKGIEIQCSPRDQSLSDFAREQSLSNFAKQVGQTGGKQIIMLLR